MSLVTEPGLDEVALPRGGWRSARAAGWTGRTEDVESTVPTVPLPVLNQV